METSLNTSVCLLCGRAVKGDHIVCPACESQLDRQRQTRSLEKTGSLGFSDAYFDDRSKLVLHVLGTDKGYCLRPQDRTGAVIVGRTRGEGLSLVDVNLIEHNAENMGVSRNHLAIRYDVDSSTVKASDLRSANGTYINDERLHPGEVRVLRHGDRIRLGRLKLGVTILHELSALDMG